MKSTIIKSLMMLAAFMLLISLSGCGDNNSDGPSSNRNLLYEVSLPIFPVDPTDPDKPVDPIDPERPIEPTDPTNTIPVANAGADQNIQVPTSISLDGSQSYDADGDALTYKWVLKEKPTGSGAVLSDSTSINPSFTADIEGVYRTELVVNDGKADSPADSMFVTFNKPVPDNQPPVSVPDGPTTVIVKRNAPTSAANILLDGSKSYDDGLIQPLSYTWSSGKYSVNESRVYLNATCSDNYEACAEDKEHPICTYRTNLEVFDGEFSDNASLSTQVDYTDCVETPSLPSPDNLPPVAVIKPLDNLIIVNKDETITLRLDGSDSYDQDTLIEPITYTWRSGTYIVNTAVAVAYLSCQNQYTDCTNPENICAYNVNLEVFDGELSDNEKITVNVDYTNCIGDAPLVCGEIPQNIKPDRIYITNNPETVSVAETVQLTLWGVYYDGTECDITLESASVWSIPDKDDKKIASIGTKTGIVQGKDVGTAIVETKHRADGTDSTVTSVVNVIE